MMKIYCLGNDFFKEDSLAKEVANEIKIKGFEFVKCDSIDEFEGNIIILDVLKGTNKVVLINDLEKLKNFKATSSHDFDLITELKLKKAIGQLKKISIIAIPQKGNKKKIIKDIKSIISTL